MARKNTLKFEQPERLGRELKLSQELIDQLERDEPLKKDRDGWYLIWKCGENETVHYCEKHVDVDQDGDPTNFEFERMGGSPIAMFELQFMCAWEAFNRGKCFEFQPFWHDKIFPEDNFPWALKEVIGLIEQQQERINYLQFQRRGRPPSLANKKRDDRLVELKGKMKLSWAKTLAQLEAEGFPMTKSAARQAFDRRKKRKPS